MEKFKHSPNGNNEEKEKKCESKHKSSCDYRNVVKFKLQHYNNAHAIDHNPIRNPNYS